MKAVTCPVILTGCSTRVDKSMSLRFSTPELSSTDKAAFMDLQGLNLTALFQPVDDAPQGLVEVKGEFDQKSPSERLRAVIFVRHKQLTLQHKIAVSFDDFYREIMNRIIQDQKDQLEPATF